MLVGTNIVSRQTLKNMHDNGKTYLEIWEKFGEQWIRKLFDFMFFNYETDSHSFCFEAICQGRCGLFGDNIHNELACSYERDRLIFLGVSLCDKRFYIPHSVYTQKFNCSFEEPLYWIIQHSSQVNNMLEDLGQMILNRMSKKEFLLKYPPSNKNFILNSEKQIEDQVIEDAVIDFEGWVAMKSAQLEIKDADHVQVVNKLNIVKTIYSKIKTEPYYRSHKYHENNIPYLIELSKTAGHIFPLARKITGLLSGQELNARFEAIGKKTMEFLDLKSEKGKQLLNDLQKIFDKNLKDAEIQFANKEINKLPKNPLNGLENRPFDVQCRIILNFQGFNFSSLLVPIYLEMFPEIDPLTPNLENIIFGLTMTLQPWTTEYQDKIKELNPKSTCVQELITACLGTSII
jgi:hypothetical protein